MEQDLTKGSPTRLIVRFCLPLMAGNLFQQFYNMVDSIVVGKFVGKDALSAVGSVSSLNFLVIGSIIGLCSGFSIPVSQSFGAGDTDKIRKLIANILWLSLALGGTFTAITLSLSRQFLHILNIPQNIFADAYSYIVIIFGGITATILYNVLASLIRAVGDSKTPLYFLIFSSLLNVVLDLVFVIFFSLGVKGVAIATVISQVVSGLLCLWYIKRNFFILHFRRSDAKPDGKMCRELLYSGIPMSLQFSITAIGSVMLQSCVNSLGSDIIAAMTAAWKTQTILILPSETIGLTMATFCGQNLGAKRLDRIIKGVRRALLLASAYSIIAILISYFAGTYISLLFINRSETVVLGYIDWYLRTVSPMFPLLVVLFVMRYSLQGLGFSIPAMMSGVFELVARGIMGFGFVLKYGFNAVRFANPVAWAAGDLFLVPMYFYAIHKLKKTIGTELPPDNNLPVTERTDGLERS
jgi:putative MATE family efflux protein